MFCNKQQKKLYDLNYGSKKMLLGASIPSDIFFMVTTFCHENNISRGDFVAMAILKIIDGTAEGRKIDTLIDMYAKSPNRLYKKLKPQADTELPL